MAADILIYDSDIVPVGADQMQHIEVARDIAGSFNHLFGETFVLPKYKVLESSAKVPGTDGEKMSKSYNNTIEIFEDAKAMRKKVMRITTDSRPMEQPKPDFENDHLYQLYSLFATDAQRDEMAALYQPRQLWLRPGENGPGRHRRAVFCLRSAPSGPSWPPICRRSKRFWPTVPSRLGKRRPKYSRGHKRLAVLKAAM